MPFLVDFKDAIHSGYYHCEAENKWGKAKSEVLFVSSTAPIDQENMKPPTFIEDLGTIYEVSSGSPLQMTCKGSEKSAQQPRIQWTFNGINLDEFNDKEILVIPEFETKNVGSYSCNISNEVGYVYSNAAVAMATKFDAFRYEFYMQGYIETFPCNAYIDTTKATWYFNNEKMTNDSDQYFISNRGELALLKLIPGNSNGIYECRGKDSFGDDSSAFINLAVQPIIHSYVDLQNDNEITCGSKDFSFEYLYHQILIVCLLLKVYLVSRYEIVYSLLQMIFGMTRHGNYEQSKEFTEFVDKVDTFSTVDTNKKIMVFLSNEPNDTANIFCKSKDQELSFEDTSTFVGVRTRCIFHFPNQNHSTFNCTSHLRNKAVSNNCEESQSVDKECSLPCFCHGLSSVCQNSKALYRSMYMIF